MASMTFLKLARMHIRVTLDDLTKELGKETGVGKFMFTKIENGENAASKKTQAALCVFFGIRKKSLFNKRGMANKIKFRHIRMIEKDLFRRKEQS